MTTIATDGRIIAYDTLETSNYGRASRVTEKAVIREVHGALHVFALAGTGAYLDPFISWYASGAEPDKMPVIIDRDIADYSVLVIRKFDMAIFSSLLPFPQAMRPPAVLGSGGDWARGAMEVGADPIEAVKAAVRIDPNSGGPVHYIDLDRLFGR